MPMKKRLITITGCVLLGAVVASLSACNAVDGAGKDLQESSQNVKNAASGD